MASSLLEGLTEMMTSGVDQERERDSAFADSLPLNSHSIRLPFCLLCLRSSVTNTYHYNPPLNQVFYMLTFAQKPFPRGMLWDMLWGT